MRAGLGIVMILAAMPFGLIALYLVAYEVADDEPQYASFYPIEHVRGWLAAAIVGVFAAALVLVGARLLRRERN